MTSEWILSAKLQLLWQVFIVHLVNFAKPAWCSNCSKFVRSRVHIQVYCPVCVARFCWSLWTRSQTFATLVSKSESLKRGPRAPWGLRNCSLGATCRGRAGPQAEAKTRYFYWWAGGHKCWESFEGGHDSWKFENHCYKWCWQVLLVHPAISGRTTGQFSPKFLKTCSVEYTSWVRPCLLSQIKLWFVFSLKTMAIQCFFFCRSLQYLLEKKCPALKICRLRTM